MFDCTLAFFSSHDNTANLLLRRKIVKDLCLPSVAT